MKKSRILTALGIVFGVLFLGLIILLLTFDLRPIGPQNTVIGLAGINKWFYDLLGTNELCYEITEYLGLAAFGAVGIIALVALAEWIKRKSLWKIGFDLWLTVAFLGLMAVLYVLFEVVIINYRPVLEEGEIAASFPSSHTMLVFCVMWASAWCAHRIPWRGVRITVQTLCILILLVTAVGRLLSGVHWFTDILGGVLVSLSLGCFYSACTCQTLQKGKHDQ